MGPVVGLWTPRSPRGGECHVLNSLEERSSMNKSFKWIQQKLLFIIQQWNNYAKNGYWCLYSLLFNYLQNCSDTQKICTGHTTCFHLSTTIWDTVCSNKYSMNYAWGTYRNIQWSSSEFLLLQPNFKQNWNRWTNSIKDYWNEQGLKSVRLLSSC